MFQIHIFHYSFQRVTRQRAQQISRSFSNRNPAYFRRTPDPPKETAAPVTEKLPNLPSNEHALGGNTRSLISGSGSSSNSNQAALVLPPLDHTDQRPSSFRSLKLDSLNKTPTPPETRELLNGKGATNAEEPQVPTILTAVPPVVSPQLHFDWKLQLASLRDSPLPLDAQKLANVVENIHFSHLDNVTELIRDWSDLLVQLKDEHAWKTLFQRVSDLGDEGLMAVWKGYVRCGDRGFAINKFTAAFLFQCSVFLGKSSVPWLVRQYQAYMLPSPFRTSSPPSQDMPRTHNHEFLSDLWYDMLCLPTPALLKDLWLSSQRSSPVYRGMLANMNTAACYSILNFARSNRDINARLQALDFCLQILEMESDTMSPKNQTKITTLILNHCRVCVGQRSMREVQRQTMFFPIIERADRLIRSYKLDENWFNPQLMPSLMSAYDICYRHDKVVQIWQELRVKNEINTRVVAVLLDSCGFHGDKTLALSTWSALRNEGFALEENSWAAYMECLGRLGEWQMVLDILCIDMKNQQGDPSAPYPTPSNLLGIINQWTQSTRRNTAVNVLERIKKELPELFLHAQDVRRQYAFSLYLDSNRRRTTIK